MLKAREKGYKQEVAQRGRAGQDHSRTLWRKESTWGRACRQKPVVSELQTEPAPVCSPASGTYADLSNSDINKHVSYISTQKTHVHKYAQWQTESSCVSGVVPLPRQR